jgi:hypothetical protein
MNMSSGDMVVVGLVADVHIIEDIGVTVPRGVAVTIPGHLTLTSKDLHRALSQKHLVLLHQPPSTLLAVRASTSLSKEERDRMEAELQRLTSQNEALVMRNAALEKQVDSLQAELAGLKAKDAKLDAILLAIHERPAVVQVAAPVAAVSAPSEGVVSGDAPMFIPSMMKVRLRNV